MSEKQTEAHLVFEQKYLGRPVTTKPPMPLADQFQHAISASGRSPWAILFEAIRLMFSAQKLRWYSYYHFGLYRRSLSFAQKKKYVDFQDVISVSQRVHRTRPYRSEVQVDDKYSFKTILDANGIPVPRLQLVLGTGCASGGVNIAKSVNDLIDFFSKHAKYPVFCKPIVGTLGRGGFAISGVNAKEDQLFLSTGQIVPLSEFCKDVLKYYGDGYLIEDFVVQHPAMTEMFGPTPAVLRVATAKAESAEPEPLFQFLRFVDGDAMGIHYENVETYKTSVDVETGAIDAEVYKTSRFTTEKPKATGVNGQPLSGFKIPFVNEAIQYAIESHKLFPDMGLIGFDVIISKEGPVFLEGNGNPHVFYPQILMDCGFLDGKTGSTINKIIKTTPA